MSATLRRALAGVVLGSWVCLPTALQAASARHSRFGAAPVNAADESVQSPDVNLGAFDIVFNGSTTIDNRAEFSRDQGYSTTLNFSPLPYLRVGVVGDMDAPPAESLAYDATALRTSWQLTPRHAWWADLGLFAEYSQAHGKGEPNSFTLGPTLQKDDAALFGRQMIYSLNLFMETDVGPNNTGRIGAELNWQGHMAISPYWQPGIEAYGTVNNIYASSTDREPEWQIGPMITGSVPGLASVTYTVTYRFGLDQAVAHGEVLWRLAYGVRF